MNKLKQVYLSLLPLIILSNEAIATDKVTQFKYDARGRLIQAADDAGREVNYTYDDAGNRVSVFDETAAQILEPVIHSFNAPSTVKSPGSYATISWGATDAVYCALALFDDYSTYPNLPTSGAQSIQIHSNTAVTLTCFNGPKSDSQGKLIRILL